MGPVHKAGFDSKYLAEAPKNFKALHQQMVPLPSRQSIPFLATVAPNYPQLLARSFPSRWFIGRLHKVARMPLQAFGAGWSRLLRTRFIADRHACFDTNALMTFDESVKVQCFQWPMAEHGGEL